MHDSFIIQKKLGNSIIWIYNDLYVCETFSEPGEAFIFS